MPQLTPVITEIAKQHVIVTVVTEIAKHHVTVTVVTEIAKHHVTVTIARRHVTVTVVRERSQTAYVILWTLCEARDTSHVTGRLALAEQELAAASTNGGTIVETQACSQSWQKMANEFSTGKLVLQQSLSNTACAACAPAVVTIDDVVPGKPRNLIHHLGVVCLSHNLYIR